MTNSLIRQLMAMVLSSLALMLNRSPAPTHSSPKGRLADANWRKNYSMLTISVKGDALKMSADTQAMMSGFLDKFTNNARQEKR